MYKKHCSSESHEISSEWNVWNHWNYKLKKINKKTDLSIVLFSLTFCMCNRILQIIMFACSLYLNFSVLYVLFVSYVTIFVINAFSSSLVKSVRIFDWLILSHRFHLEFAKGLFLLKTTLSWKLEWKWNHFLYLLYKISKEIMLKVYFQSS